MRRPHYPAALVHHCANVLRLVVALFLLSGAAAAQQGDGARAYILVPDGTRIGSVWALNANGNGTLEPGRVFQGQDVDVSLAILQYTQTVEVGGQQAGLFAVVPMGGLDVDFNFSFGTRTGTSSGLGDIVLGGVFGIFGSPALSRQEFAAFDPGASMGVLAKVSLPTGAYDPDKLVNLGSNRVWGQLGLPMGYALGTSYLDPSLMTFEVIPSVIFYGDNTDPFGAASSTGQEPLGIVEAHITRNFSRAVWGSLDAVYLYGGETSTDGVGNNDTQRSLGLGATAFVALSQTSGLKVTYGETVSSNAYGADGTLIRAIWLMSF
jgi:hypothetical protein